MVSRWDVAAGGCLLLVLVFVLRVGVGLFIFGGGAGGAGERVYLPKLTAVFFTRELNTISTIPT